MVRKILALVAPLSAIAPAALAQTAGPDSLEAGGALDPISSRILSDPLYLPLAGQIYGVTSYTFTRSDGDIFNSRLPGSASSFSGDGNVLTQYLAFGLTDEFSLHAAISHSWNDVERSYFSPDGVLSTHGDSFTNPTFGLTYRLLDQAYQMPVDLDLSFDYTPDLVALQVSGPGRDGTEGAGRDRADFTLTLGREMRAFTIAGSLTATHYGDQNYVALSNNNNFTQDSGWSYRLGLATQARLTDQWSLDGKLSYVLADDLSAQNQTLGLPFLNKTPNTFDVGAGINYAIIPGNLVTGLTYDYQDISNNSANYYTLGTTTETRNHDAHIVGVNLRYAFP
jgi:opacity protein-like surface antigen